MRTGPAALAARRAAWLPCLAEPAVGLVVLVLGLLGGTTNLDLLISQQHQGMLQPQAAAALAAASLLALALAGPDAAGQTTEFSGGDLALIDLAEALRKLVWFDLIGGLFVPLGMAEPGAGPLAWAVGLLAWGARLMVLSAGLAALRWAAGRRSLRRAPQVLGTAVVLSFARCPARADEFGRGMTGAAQGVAGLAVALGFALVGARRTGAVALLCAAQTRRWELSAIGALAQGDAGVAVVELAEAACALAWWGAGLRLPGPGAIGREADRRGRNPIAANGRPPATSARFAAHALMRRGNRIRHSRLRRPPVRAGRDRPRNRSRTRRRTARPAAGRRASLAFGADVGTSSPGAGRGRDAERPGPGRDRYRTVARAPRAGRVAMVAGAGPRRALARQRSRADWMAPSAPPCRLARRRPVRHRFAAGLRAPLAARRTRRPLADRRARRARNPVADRAGRRGELGPAQCGPELGQPGCLALAGHKYWRSRRLVRCRVCSG